MPWSKDGKYWIGRHDKYGIIVVPKNSINGSFNVYFSESDRFSLCNRSIMRQHTSGNNISLAEISLAIEKISKYEDKIFREKEDDSISSTASYNQKLHVNQNDIVQIRCCEHLSGYLPNDEALYFVHYANDDYFTIMNGSVRFKQGELVDELGGLERVRRTLW